MGTAQQKPLKILIQRADKLGDTVFSLPVLESLQQRYPDAHIHFLCSSIGTRFLRSHPLIKKIYTVKWKKKCFLFHYLNLVKAIKKQKYDMYISLWNNPWMAYLGFLSGIRIRLGDQTNLSLAWLYTKKTKQQWSHFFKHQVDFNLELLSPLNPAPKNCNPKIYPNPGILSGMQSLKPLKKHSILLFCGTGGSNLSMPESVIIDFADKLKSKASYSLMLCGQTHPESPLLHLQGPHIINLLNKTTLQELIAAIAVSHIYIGGDTGPTHIAAGLNKPLIFISGNKRNAPTRWGPMCDHFSIIRKDYICKDFCIPRRCSSEKCLSYLGADLLLETCAKLENQISRGGFSEDQRRMIHQLHSIRIIYLVLSRHEYLVLKPFLENMRKKGLMVFPYYVKKWSFRELRRMLIFMIEKNVNIIQAKNCPWYIVSMIQFYFGTILQYIRPIFINQSFHRYLTLQDYLYLYSKQWEKESS